MSNRLKILMLVGVFAFGAVACGDNGDTGGDASFTDAPVLTDNAADTSGEPGTSSDAPGPVGSPSGTSAPTTTKVPDNGGGGIYDQTPSVDP